MEQSIPYFYIKKEEVKGIKKQGIKKKKKDLKGLQYNGEDRLQNSNCIATQREKKKKV